MPIRSATAEWRGALRDGAGSVETESGAVESAYSFDSRFGNPGSGAGAGSAAKKTNPEELLAAAHAACFTMAVSNELASAGHPPERATTTARVTVEKAGDGFEIPTIALRLEASVPGMDDARFQEIARGAKEACPLSKVLRAADITLEAHLV